MRILLIRHGQTAWNVESRAQGHTDIELNAVGERQAELLGLGLREYKIDRIMSSDLRRSMATAEQVALHQKLKVEPRFDLRERAFGEWEGLGFRDLRSRSQLAAEAQGMSIELVVPPGGESFCMVWERLHDVAKDLRSSKGVTAVVTHGGSCAMLLAHLLGSSIQVGRSFRFGNTGVTDLSLRGDGVLQLLRYNDLSHLALDPALAGILEEVK